MNLKAFLLCTLILNSKLSFASVDRESIEPVVLTLLGKNISQFLSLIVALGNGNSVLRNFSEKLLDESAFEILKHYEEALDESPHKDLIQKADTEAFEYISTYEALESKESLLRYFKSNQRMKLAAKLKNIIESTLEDFVFANTEETFPFDKAFRKIKKELEDIKELSEEEESKWIDKALIERTLELFPKENPLLISISFEKLIVDIRI